MAMHVTTSDEFTHGNEQRHATSTIFSWLHNAALKLSDSWSWYQNYRQSIQELQGLTDRELDDIGIPRCDIPAIAMQSANAVLSQHRA